MAKKYLDENGLAYFWSKLKQYLATTSRAGLMSPTDKAKVDAITNQGTIAYYKKLEGSYTTTGSSTSTIPIPISSYSTADILLVDINGLDLVENTDYTISGTDIVLTTPITETGQIVHFIAVRATTATASDYAMLKGDAGVVDAYPRSGATPLSAAWLSETSGGSALTPESNQIYILMADSGNYTANAMFRWNGTAYEPLTSGGDVTSSSVPTANTISEFDSTAHMNSTDMTAQEVQDFVDSLDVHGESIEELFALKALEYGTLTVYACTGTISHNQLAFITTKGGEICVEGRVNINSFTRTGSNPGVNISLPTSIPTPTKTREFLIGFRSQSPREMAVFRLEANSRTARLMTTESYANATNGTLTLVCSGRIFVE